MDWPVLKDTEEAKVIKVHKDFRGQPEIKVLKVIRELKVTKVL